MKSTFVMLTDHKNKFFFGVFRFDGEIFIIPKVKKYLFRAPSSIKIYHNIYYKGPKMRSILFSFSTAIFINHSLKRLKFKNILT